MAVICTNQASFSQPNQIIDGNTTPSYKWFSLQQNTLDGTFHPIDSSGASQIGIWGTVLSDINGALSPAPVITIDYSGQVYTLIVAGDILLNDFPKAFTVSLRDASNAEIYLATETNNTSVVWKHSLPQPVSPAKLIITIQSINKASRTFKITEGYNVFEITRSDSLLTKITETVTIQVSANRTDTLKPNITETKQVTVNIDKSDILLSKLNEASVLTVSFNKSDTLTPKVVESKDVNVSFAKSDILLAKTTDTATVTNNIGSTDTLKPNITETTFFVQLEKWSNDTLLNTISELRDTTVSAVSVDSLLVTLSEAISNVISFTSQDTILFKINESVADITAQLSSQDIVLTKLSESSSVQNLLNSIDDIRTLLTENKNITASLNSVETLLINLTENSTESVSISTSDILIANINDAIKDITAQLSSQDIVLTKILETTEITNMLTRADDVLVKTSDTSLFTLLEKWVSDNLKVNVSDIATGAEVTFTRSDTLKPKIETTKHVTNSFNKADTLSLLLNETKDIFLSIISNDILIIKMDEIKKVVNVHTMAIGDVRWIHGKVEITYTDPFRDESMGYNASEVGTYTYPEQTADNIYDPKYKWFSLHDNVLDGTYHSVPSDKSISVGWWGTALSDSSGVLSTQPTLTITFEARSILSIQAVGDSLLNVYPVDFDVTLFNSSGVVLHNEEVTGNSNVKWFKELGVVSNVTKMELKISKINKPNCVCKIVEFYTAVVGNYDNETIESIHLFEEMGYVNGSIPMGNISCNELDITLDNTDGKFNLNNIESPLYGYIKRNRRVKAWLGIEVVEGDIEWHPLGTFWTVSWKVPSNNLIASLTARDRLELLRLTDFTNTQVYENYTLYNLFEMVLTDAGLAPEEYHIDTSLQSIAIPYVWFNRSTHREILHKLATCSLVQIYCDRNGIIQVVYNTSGTENVIQDFTDDTNIFEVEFPFAGQEVINCVEVTVNQLTPKPLSDVYHEETPFVIPAGSDSTRICNFTSLPVINVQNATFDMDSDIEVISQTNYSWGVELKLRNTGIIDNTVRTITVQGQSLSSSGKPIIIAQDEASIRNDGKLKMTINHDFIQTTEYAAMLATTVLNAYKGSKYDVEINNRGDMALRLGDRVRVDTRTQYQPQEYIVYRQDITWSGSLEAKTECKKAEEV